MPRQGRCSASHLGVQDPLAGRPDAAPARTLACGTTLPAPCGWPATTPSSDVAHRRPPPRCSGLGSDPAWRLRTAVAGPRVALQPPGMGGRTGRADVRTRSWKVLGVEPALLRAPTAPAPVGACVEHGRAPTHGLGRPRHPSVGDLSAFRVLRGTQPPVGTSKPPAGDRRPPAGRAGARHPPRPCLLAALHSPTCDTEPGSSWPDAAGGWRRHLRLPSGLVRSGRTTPAATGPARTAPARPSRPAPPRRFRPTSAAPAPRRLTMGGRCSRSRLTPDDRGHPGRRTDPSCEHVGAQGRCGPVIPDRERNPPLPRSRRRRGPTFDAGSSSIRADGPGCGRTAPRNAGRQWVCCVPTAHRWVRPPRPPRPWRQRWRRPRSSDPPRKPSPRRPGALVGG